jgi:hypothetical protein
MGVEVDDRTLMSRICWWLVDALSRLLAPDERDAVRGDLIESGRGAAPAVLDVLGLVARRQSALWIDWQPWLALLGIVLPIGLLLSHASRYLADGTVLDVSLYVSLWDWSYLLDYPGWRHDVTRVVVETCLGCAVLIGWSWTSGFVLGSLSRRTAWMTGILFGLVVLLGTFGTTTDTRALHTELFSGRFLGIVLPRLVRTFLVLLPAWWGMRRAIRRSPLRLPWTIGGAVAIAILTALAEGGLEGSVTFGRNGIPPETGPDGFRGTADDPRPLWPLAVVMFWPMAFIVATTAVNHLHNKTSRAGLAR